MHRNCGWKPSAGNLLFNAKDKTCILSPSGSVTPTPCTPPFCPTIAPFLPLRCKRFPFFSVSLWPASWNAFKFQRWNAELTHSEDDLGEISKTLLKVPGCCGCSEAISTATPCEDRTDACCLSDTQDFCLAPCGPKIPTAS